MKAMLYALKSTATVFFYAFFILYLDFHDGFIQKTFRTWRKQISCFIKKHNDGEVAQLVRACGSYPQCRGFNSLPRYHDCTALCKSLFLYLQNIFLIILRLLDFLFRRHLLCRYPFTVAPAIRTTPHPTTIKDRHAAPPPVQYTLQSKHSHSSLMVRMRMTTIKVIVFDFDGTLAIPTIDFEHMKQHAFTAVQKIYPDLPALNGLPLLEWVAQVQEAAKNDAPSLITPIEEAAKAAAKEVELEAASRSDVFSWVRPLLAELASRSVTSCIVTRNCIEAITIVFPDVATFCPIILTRDDVPIVKPDPDHLLRALSLADCAPHEAIMTGDHIMDIHTGKAAGTMTAGVCTGEATRTELEAESPDFIAADCWELFQQLAPRL